MALEYVSTGSTAVRARRREAADIASFVRGLDWVLIGVVALSPIRFGRSARNPASATTSSTLPNSDGWKRKNPRSSHRFEPRVTGPATKTMAITNAVPMKIVRQRRRYQSGLIATAAISTSAPAATNTPCRTT